MFDGKKPHARARARARAHTQTHTHTHTYIYIHTHTHAYHIYKGGRKIISQEYDRSRNKVSTHRKKKKKTDGQTDRQTYRS